MKCSGLSLAGVALMASVQAANAQEVGNVRAGLAYAEHVCAECHAVHKGEGVSPHGRAPSFEAVANTRGMTSMALRVWFQSPHPSMPELRITDTDTDNIVAYILSLKKRS